jgi:hypothetical protein
MIPAAKVHNQPAGEKQGGGNPDKRTNDESFFEVLRLRRWF